MVDLKKGNYVEMICVENSEKDAEIEQISVFENILHIFFLPVTST